MATTNRPATAPRRYLSFALLAALLTLSAAAFYAISAISRQNSVTDRQDVVRVYSGLSREEEKESDEERKQQRGFSPSPQPKSETFHSVSSSDARDAVATKESNRRPVRREPCGGRFLADKRGALPELTILVQNPRTGSLFLSGRLAKYGTGRFRYVVQRLKDLSPRPYRSPDDFAQWACVDHPGHKVVVWDSGGTPNWVLQHWPRGTVLVMTGDEAGRWGLYDRKRHWGPFGDDDDTEEALFDANMSHPLHPIVLPPDVTPWFRQYADPKQAQAFDASLAIYWPLGSRFEFPDLDPAAAKSSSTRKYIASLMASTTDPSRKLLATVLNDTAIFPREKVYLHLTGGWHPDLNNEAYIRPETYAEVLQDSVFAPCPKGHSLETFRFYEAIEAGAIPIIELGGGKAHDFFPPEYFAAPIVVVDRWSDMPRILGELFADSQALDERQRRLTVWYVSFMKAKARALENIAIQHARGVA